METTNLSLSEIDCQPIATMNVVNRSSIKRIRQIGGSSELASIYNRTIALMRDLEMFHVTRQESVDGVVHTYLCNYWRIDRHIDGRIMCFTLNLKTRKWAQVNNFEDWPSIPFWPLNRTKSENTWEMLYTMVFWKVMRLMGYDAYQRSERKHVQALKLQILNEIRKENQVGPVKALPRRKNSWMESEIIARMPSYSPSAKLQALFRHQIITCRYDKFDGARYALVKHIFNGVLDKPLFRKVLCTHWNGLSLDQYLAYASNRESVLQIIEERKSLFPMLWSIPYENWSNPSCLSRQSLTSASQLITPAGYKWLHDTSVVVTSSKHLRENIHLANLLGLIKTEAKTPVLLWKKLIQIDERMRRRIERSYVVSEFSDKQLIRLFELYAKQALTVREAYGHESFKKFLSENYEGYCADEPVVEIYEILDFLIYHGFRTGFPHKNSTWNSLSRQSLEWHEELVKRKLGKDFSWSDSLSERVPQSINGIKITPLLSLYELYEEGRAMHHCIVSYAKECDEGQYRVFSLTSTNDETIRSTLGLCREGESWKIDQHKSFCNRAVSQAHAKLGKEICKIYNNLSKELE